MNDQEIFNEVKTIFSRTISDKIVIKPDTASRDVRNWDSLNHVMFVTEVEKVFSIRFDLNDMLEMHSIADICKGVEGKLNSI